MEISFYYLLLVVVIFIIWYLLKIYIIINYDSCFCVYLKIYIILGIVAFIYLIYHLQSHKCNHSNCLIDTIKYSNIKVWSIILFISILIIIMTKYKTFAIKY